jgi:hypothetical protein
MFLQYCAIFLHCAGHILVIVYAMLWVLITMFMLHFGNFLQCYAMLWVLFTIFLSHFGHCLQCLCNIVSIVYNVHVITVGIAYNGHHILQICTTMFQTYYCLQCS